jgi:hypothetical protein
MLQTAVIRLDAGLSLEDILIEELALYVEDEYSARFSPVFWRTVFIRWYGNAPTSDADKRWDELFKIGYPILRKLLEE